jgi:hypothetical protein
MVELYLEFTKRLHGIVLNNLSTGAILPLPYLSENMELFSITPHSLVETRMPLKTLLFHKLHTVLFSTKAKEGSTLLSEDMEGFKI